MSKARGVASQEARFKVKITKLYQRTADRARLAPALTAKAAQKRARKAARWKAQP